MPHYPNAIAYPLHELESETHLVQELVGTDDVGEEEEPVIGKEPLQFCLVGATYLISSLSYMHQHS